VRHRGVPGRCHDAVRDSGRRSGADDRCGTGRRLPYTGANGRGRGLGTPSGRRLLGRVDNELVDHDDDRRFLDQLVDLDHHFRVDHLDAHELDDDDHHDDDHFDDGHRHHALWHHPPGHHPLGNDADHDDHDRARRAAQAANELDAHPRRQAALEQQDQASPVLEQVEAQ
jgi:hypothetical protein